MAQKVVHDVVALNNYQLAGYSSEVPAPAYTTFQSIILDMSNMELWVHFTPASDKPPLQPTYQQIVNPIY